MGCKVCRGAIEENQYDFSNQKHSKESLDNFFKQIECTYIKEDEFVSAIPEEYQNGLKEKLILPPDLKENKTYEVPPIKFKNGNIFKGKWNTENRMDGNGIYYLSNDKVLVNGFWENGELKYGKIFMPNDTIYEGYIKNSIYNGKGKLIQSEGKEYDGIFDNGVFIKGKVKINDAIFEGELENEQFKTGKIEWNNGYKYEGDFNGNILQGKGKLISPDNGDIYEGDFDNNFFHGQGKYIFSKSQNEYEGDWDNNLPHGIGKISNIENTYILKSAFRYGKMVDEPTFEKGQKSDINFNLDELLIDPGEMNIIKGHLKDLSNLDSQATLYKLENLPSFLNE